MRITVTGGAGFIGRYVVEEARRRGHRVLVFDSTTGFDVREFGPGHAGDAVIHLAGVLGTAELFDRAAYAVDVNVLGSLRVIEACAAADAHLVQITMPQVWRNVYQATKNCAGALADAWMEHRDLRVTHVCAFNAYGPGQKVDGVRKIIPTFSTAAWRGRPIEVWGSGESLVDLIHAQQLAEILVTAAERAPGDGETIEAGTGLGLTVNEVAAMVLSMVHGIGGLHDDMIVHSPMRPGEAELTTGTVSTGKGLDLIDIDGPGFDTAALHECVAWYREDRP